MGGVLAGTVEMAQPPVGTQCASMLLQTARCTFTTTGSCDTLSKTTSTAAGSYVWATTAETSSTKTWSFRSKQPSFRHKHPPHISDSAPRQEQQKTLNNLHLHENFWTTKKK